MVPSFHRVLIVLGLLSLLHSAFSAAQHRSYLRITSQVFTSLPLDIVVQAVSSLLLVVWGVLSRCHGLRAVTAADENMAASANTLHNNANFYMYNHRGRLLVRYLLAGKHT